MRSLSIQKNVRFVKKPRKYGKPNQVAMNDEPNTIRDVPEKIVNQNQTVCYGVAIATGLKRAGQFFQKEKETKKVL